MGHEVPWVWPAEIIIACGGRTHTLRTQPHKGSPSDPFTWDEICEKFRRYTASIIERSTAAALIDVVGHLEQTPDIADVASLLARR